MSVACILYGTVQLMVFQQLHPLPSISTDYKGKTHRVFWEDTKEIKGQRIEFDGTPFFLLGTKTYDCQHGQDRNAALKAKQQELRRQKQVKANLNTCSISHKHPFTVLNILYSICNNRLFTVSRLSSLS